MKRVVGHVKAVDGIDITLTKGKTMGLVGESGCGKTTAGRTILRAYDPSGGSVLFQRPNGEVVDVATLSRRFLRSIWTDIQMIFQDPYGSLNPRMRVSDLIAEPLQAHGWSRKKAEARVRELMAKVGLDSSHLRRYPHAFSGGQRQRIGIARALALGPSLIIADEPVSALDVSVQAQILSLLKTLREEMNLTLLFIAHDLSVVRYLCDDVAVMYNGRIVEQAETEKLFTQPRHPYTATLMHAVPPPDPDLPWNPDAEKKDAEDLEGKKRVSEGCPFAPRCPYRIDVCWHTVPPLAEASGSNGAVGRAACIRHQELSLTGV